MIIEKRVDRLERLIVSVVTNFAVLVDKIHGNSPVDTDEWLKSIKEDTKTMKKILNELEIKL